ncbi:MAG: type II secretion system F family protein [Desulfonatronovibrionaceae bacterium]
MPTYRYQALDQQGRTKKGHLDSESRTSAFQELENRGLVPVLLDKVRARNPVSRDRLLGRLSFAPRVRLEEAFYYLGMMLQGGASLTFSLDLLSRMSRSRASRLWVDIKDSVEAGTSFSSSLERHSGYFSPAYVNMIRIAEHTGRLGEILEKIAGYEEHRRQSTARLITAASYPLVVFIIGMGAVFFLLTAVLPGVADIVRAGNQTLPAGTRFLLTLGQWMDAYGIILPLILLAAGTAFWFGLKKNRPFRYWLETILWKVPLVRNSILARFSSLLSFELKAGISLVQAMQGASTGVNSLFFRNHIHQASLDVAAGRSLDAVLEGRGIFPAMYLTALAAGQKSGQLPEFLDRLGTILENQVENTLRRLMALAEPLLILVLGIMVALFVLAVMGPVFDLTSGINYGQAR